MRKMQTFKRVLITGVSGSGGSYLAEYIAANHPNIEIHGTSRWHSTTQNNLRNIINLLEVHEVDLVDFGSVFETLRKVCPDAIFHLAAYANVRTSFITPTSVLNNNIISTSNLFEAVRLLGQQPTIQLCSTSEVYGQVDPSHVPINEDTPLKPTSPYAVSKVAQDLLGKVYSVAYGMKIIRTRMFTYINPRRADLFATSFARQIARIEAGLQTKLIHGNLDSVRTLLDVRDAMRAYWMAIELCEPGEAYNIGGNTTISVAEVLQKLIGMATTDIRTYQDPHLLRPADVTLQIPNMDKFVKLTGWGPTYSIDDSLRSLLDYWRNQVNIEVSELRYEDITSFPIQYD